MTVNRNSFEQYVWMGFSALFPVVGFVAPRSGAALVAATTIIALGFLFWNEKSVRALRSQAWFPLFACLALLLLGAVINSDNPYGMERFSRLSLLLLLGFLLLLLMKNKTQENNRPIGAALLIGYSVGLILLAFHVATQHGLYGLLNPNNHHLDILHAANRPTVIMVLCFSAVFLAARKNWPNQFSWVLAGLVTVLAFLSESQSAALGMVAWLTAYGFAALAPNVAIQLVTWAGAGLILSMPLVFVTLLNFDTMRSIDLAAASVGARLDIWFATSLEVVKSPIWGHGLEASRSIKDWQIDLVYFVGPNIPHAHNGLLQIWLDLGLIGASATAAIWVYLSWRIRSYCVDKWPALISGLVAFLCVLSVSHGVWQSWWISVVFGATGLTFWSAQRLKTDAK